MTVTVGLRVDVVEIGLVMHLWHVRPCTRTYGCTELQSEPLRGGGAPPTSTCKCCALWGQSSRHVTKLIHF